MKFQIIVTPCAAFPPMHTNAPFGALYIARALIEDGHSVRIENCDAEQLGYRDLLLRIKEFKPDVIGLSGVIVMSYKFIKELSFIIKREFPKVKIIIGGGVTVAGRMLLENSAADILVIGEGDITIRELMDCLVSNRSYHAVSGIAFKENGEIKLTPPREPIRNLDILKYPAFDLIDMNKYLLDIKDIILSYRHYKNPDRRIFQPHRSKRMLRILFGRGCISRCSFCFRPTAGLRQFSLPYVFDYIEYLMNKFNINIFSFGDECFSPNKDWNWKFLSELKKRKLDILFQIMGMRVDTVDRELLRAFKEAGCLQIFYGIESGSQRILDIIDKKTNVQQNFQALRETIGAGIYTAPNFLFGLPGETTETVKESISFLKKLNLGANLYQYVYVLTVPKTPLYDYSKAAGLILDEDKYLENLFYVNTQELVETNVFINFSSESLKMVKNWPRLVKDELSRHYFSNKIVYLFKKYLKPKDFYYSLKRSGLKMTLGKLSGLFTGLESRPSHRYSPVVQEPSSQRDRYRQLVNKYIGRNDKRLSLRQIIMEIERDTALAQASRDN